MSRSGSIPRKKIRVVLDTNILVSAWLWEGNESKIVELTERGILLGYSSPKLIDELKSVLNHPKFKLSQEEVASAISYYGVVLRVVEPRIVVNAIREDVADNEILACALSVKASSIVTGDRHLLALNTYKGVKISTSREFLRVMDVKDIY